MGTRNEGDPHYKKSIKELVRGIATKWRTLTEEERKPFEQRSQSDKKRYEQEI
jgi:hypothetical protein